MTIEKKQKARAGRPGNAQETATFQVTLPLKAHGYLDFLAKNTMLGPTLNEVAALLLVNQLTEMARTKFHDHQIPQR